MGRLLPFGIFIIMVFLMWRGLSVDPKLLPSALIDHPMPAFRLSLLEVPANDISEQEFVGQVSLLNVWASWCPSCRLEHPVLTTIANLKKVSLIGLNYKDKREEAMHWLKVLGNPYKAVIFDPQGKLAIDLGVYGTPETYLIDASGIIRYRHLGPLTQDAWEKQLLPFIERLKAGQAKNERGANKK